MAIKNNLANNKNNKNENEFADEALTRHPIFSRTLINPSMHYSRRISFQSKGTQLPDDFSLILLEIVKQRWDFVSPIERSQKRQPS